MGELPWAPRSRQKVGDLTEKDIVKKRGGRLHPRSGAGRIKDDGSTDDEVLEIKDAMETHTLKGNTLLQLWKRAARQGKEAHYIIYFTKADITATVILRKGKQ